MLAQGAKDRACMAIDCDERGGLGLRALEDGTAVLHETDAVIDTLAQITLDLWKQPADALSIGPYVGAGALAAI